MAVSNYGIKLIRETSTVADVVRIDPPEITHETKESTSHGSGGWKEKTPGKLKGIEEFSVVINWEPNKTDPIEIVPGEIQADLLSNNIILYKIRFNTSPLVTWEFYTRVIGISPEEMDSQSPETMQATITFSPTGDLTIN